MRRTTTRGSVLLLAIFALAASRGAAQESATPPETPQARPNPLLRAVSSRLTIGARVARSWLEDDRRSSADGYDNANRSGNFLGSLWGLDPKQSYLPRPFLEYRIVSAFGVGVAYDQLRVKTLDWGDAERTVTAGDGDLRMRGGQAFVFGRFANRTRLTPYARVGFAYYWSAFFESSGWATPNRAFEVGDSRGWLADAGVRVAAYRGLAVDASYQHLQLSDVKAAVRFTSGGKGTKGVFPVRNDAAALSLSYSF